MKYYRFRAFFHNIRRRIIVALALIILAFSISFGYAFLFIENLYTVSASIMLLNNQSADNTVESQFQKYQTTSDIAANCAVLINSTDLIQLALNKHDIKQKAIDFRDHFKVEQVESSHVIRITVQYSDPAVLAAMANTYAEAACAQIQDTYRIPSISAVMIERATPPSRLPNIWRSVGAGLLGSFIMLVFYIIVSAFLAAADKTVRSESQLLKLTGEKVLCSVPKGQDSAVRGAGSHNAFTGTAMLARTGDAYRVLRSAIKYSPRPIRTIAVVSPMPKDGRTSVAVGLATAFADSSNSKILIVEADIRKPHMKTMLSLDTSQGLADVLMGKSGIASAIAKTTKKNLFVLASSSYQTANSVNPPDILDTDNMEALLEALRDKFDYIVIDTPAAALVPDATCISGNVDACLMVARYGYTNIDAFSNVLESLKNTGANVIGTVMTAMPQQYMSRALENYYSRPSIS